LPLTQSVVHQNSEHKHIARGDGQVDSKTFKVGNTTVTIHSPLVNMTKKERQEWYAREWEKGNPVLKGIVEAVQDCLQSS